MIGPIRQTHLNRVSYSQQFIKQQPNDNKKIFAKRFLYFTEIMNIAKDCNHSDYQHSSCVSLEQS